MFSEKKVIVWDWNGTLLNDVDICIESMNNLLSRRKMELIHTSQYKEIFDFPVVNYYKKLGFDFATDTFEDLSVEFMSDYTERLKKALLFEDVVHILQILKDKQKNQLIISAMQQNSLENSVNSLDIMHFFDELIGLNNIYAAGKKDLAKNYFSTGNIPINDILFIGDTLHDYDVARHVGADCVLISKGHHSKKRLLETHVKVLDTHKDLLSLL